MRIDCEREQDVMDAVAAGRWPVRPDARLDAELREHIACCPVCGDLAAVLAAVAVERDSAWVESAVPPASVVWWRAQIRAREEASRRAARPIVIVQGAAVSLLIAAALVLLPLAWPLLETVAESAAEISAWTAPRAAAVSTAFTFVTGTAAPVLPFAVASVLLAPVLLYYALTGE